MKKYTLVLPCHFGMEAVLKREIIDLGYEISEVSDGKVSFVGDAEAIALSNIFLRTPERVMILLKEFKARSFEELFEGVKSIPFEEYLPQNANFPVTKASFINSKLASARDIQSITKKAIVERLKSKYKIGWFNEDGALYPIRVFIKDDVVTVTLDTTGDSLHKRGYKKRIAKAPISETLAASLIMLTPFKEDRLFFDPFCGTGTFAIEAALMAKNIAPGMGRDFLSMKWENLIPGKVWDDAFTEAKDLANYDAPVNIYGYDIDNENIGHAKANAALAKMEGAIHFKDCDVKDALKDFYKLRDEYGFIVTNPPYGERLKDSDLKLLYKALGDMYKELPTWSMYVITSFTGAEKFMGLKSMKNRKVYNGMKKSYYLQFPGPKPPKPNY